MHDIDFLPVQYYQQNVRRQSQPWRIVVVVIFVALVGATTLAQHHRRQYVEAELAAVTPPYELAVGQSTRLAGIQVQLQKARRSAELYTYLQHPWPRTQLLVALLAPLPDNIVFEQLQITREKPLSQAPTERRFRPEKVSEEEDLTKLPPAERDLKALREEFDKMQTVIHISGTTAESGSLHRYLGELGKNDLFAKAELNSLESVEHKGGATMRFKATVFVRPGYGQPGGPTRPPKTTPAPAQGRTA